MALFDRDDLVAGLRDLVDELRAAGETAGIRIVGGAALALRHYDRRSTADLDALHVRPGSDAAVAAAAARVADRRGWDAHWLNFEVTATGAEPLYGRATTWETVHDDGQIVIQVAGADTLLAMKLRSNRPGRDTEDIRQLLAICGVHTVEDADAFFSEFYPGEGLPDRAWRMVEAILRHGALVKPKPMSPLDLGLVNLPSM